MNAFFFRGRKHGYHALDLTEFPEGGRWRLYLCDGNYVKPLRLPDVQLVIWRDGQELPLVLDEKIQFAADFDFVEFGLSSSAYTKAVYDKLSHGIAKASAAGIVFESGYTAPGSVTG